MAKTAKPDDDMQSNNALVIDRTADETGAQAMARKLLGPSFRHALTASTFTKQILGNDFDGPGITDFIGHVQAVGEKAEAGDLAFASRVLAAQAITLDSMFSELARRAALNMGEYLNAAERYGRLALKAQTNCRATVEALTKLHQPREQTVRHVHVNEGGQAVVADHFHNHTGVRENDNSIKQSDATQPAGASAALLSPNETGNGVPIPCRARETAMQNARRDKPGPA